MNRQHFHEQLDQMYQDVLHMGTLVEEALRKALTAISNGDFELAETITRQDGVIDELQFGIDERCAKLIATEQPVATDLREIIVAMKIAGDLERIGDHARHLVRSIDQLCDSVFEPVWPLIREMTGKGIDMVHDSLTAYVDHDATSARAVARRDDEIDALHRRIYTALLEAMERHPDRIAQGTTLAFLNRFLERLGDHVTNMCEWIVYARTGEHVELNKT